MAYLQVDVVSAEEQLFGGEAKFVALPGEAGELGIQPGQPPLIPRNQPGPVKIVATDGTDVNIFVAAGVHELQPGAVTVLSDPAIRAEGQDEAKALQAR